MVSAVEMRDIEIFLTLAEELHFGRTAERLHITQARVSQAIKAQERRIGGAFFDRTSRTVALTPLGHQLRADLLVGYQAIERGLARASETARGIAGTVRLGAMGAVAHELTTLFDAFRARHPGSDVVTREIHLGDPFAELRRGDVDLAMLWRPVKERDLVEGPVVFTEGRFMAMSDSHELAERESVSMEDFGGQVVPSAGPAYWLDSMVPRVTPAGRPTVRGPAVATFHELLHVVSSGQALAAFGQHYPRYYSHPGIALVPVRDAPRTEWALVWRDDDLDPRTRSFIDLASSIGPRAFGG
ncbi:LysR substrate-binding domain-containing protein [Nocardioides sp. NPDC126508]